MPTKTEQTHLEKAIATLPWTLTETHTVKGKPHTTTKEMTGCKIEDLQAYRFEGNTLTLIGPDFKKHRINLSTLK